MLRSAIALPIVLLLAAGGSAAQAAPPPPASQGLVTVTTDNETPVLYDDEGGNASGDDPAIWVHPGDSNASLVIVTAKEGGLRVYDLDDHELQSMPASPAPQPDAVDGRYNNVDIAYGLQLGDEVVDVAVVSDRFNDTLRFFRIDPAGAAADPPLTEITASAPRK
jgi:3-phytase